MSAKIIPFPAAPSEPSLTERLAARRAYRAKCRELAADVVSKAFTESWMNDPRFGGLCLGDALPLFVAAMRREVMKPLKGPK